MRLRSSKAACYIGAAIVLFITPVLPAVATTYEKTQNTDTGIKVASYSANTEEVLVTGYEETGTYKNKAVAITDPYLDVYDTTDEDTSEVVGRLYTNTLVDVDSVGKEWTKVSSGNCEGYVLTQCLCFGEEAEALAQEVGTDNLLTGYTIAEIQAIEAEEEAARQAAEEAAAEEAAANAQKDEESDSEDVEYDEDGNAVDNTDDSESEDDEESDENGDDDTSSDDVEYDEYGNVIDSDNTVSADDYENEQSSSSDSSSYSGSGSSVVDYATQFVGNPYVWGGTSLTNGADCSGFVQSVYANFGISLPRTSYEQQYAGTEVSYADAQPGDLICYGGHVAIYMGNGRIVHASNSVDGIKISDNAAYRTIVSVRRLV